MYNKLIPYLLLLSLFLFQSELFAEAKDTEGNIKERSIATIQQLVDQRNLDRVIFSQFLSSRDLELQIVALNGLARIGTNEVVEIVTPFLTNENASVRRAAVFALGISEPIQSNQTPSTKAISSTSVSSKRLWSMLKKETNETVKQEIYLALGLIGGPNLVTELLAQIITEKALETKDSIFQALSSAISYHKNVSEQISPDPNQSLIDFSQLLKLMENDDRLSYSVGYFLARITQIENHLSSAQLVPLTNRLKSPANKRILVRLIGKVTKKNHPENRQLLSWLIEQSESDNVTLVVESINAMGSLLDIAQARLQLGKLHGAKNPLIAQSAFQVLANSSLDGMQIMQLLKKQLKSKNPAMVVTAISGLVKRQERDEMSWAIKILSHKSDFVRIRFAQIIANKDKKGFTNVLKMISKGTNSAVADYAKSLLSDDNPKAILTKTQPYKEALESVSKRVVLHTSAGDIQFKMNDQAVYTSARFIQLVKQGYYNGSYFSRMVGNFVAQGGDSIGDMDGGSGKMIREEISYLSHLKGSVGMATSGKDTGDSQFFVNLGDNLHLDRKYTLFAEVVNGMDVIFQLSNGDKIISAEILKE